MKFIRKKINRLNEIADPTLGGVSSMVQKNPGYVYKVMSLNHDLEQKVNQKKEEHYIHPGCRVRGVGFNNPKLHFTGRVQRIVKNSNGEIEYIQILVEKTSKIVKIRADENLELLINRGDPPVNPPAVMNPSYVASKI